MLNISIREVPEFSKTIRNVLFRNGVKTMEDLRRHVEEHPFNKPFNTNTDYEAWRGIGPDRYEEITRVLNIYKERA